MLSIEQPYLVTVSSDDGTLSSMDVLYTEGYESTSDDEVETRSFSWGTDTFCFVLPYKTSVDCEGTTSACVASCWARAACSHEIAMI